MKKLKFTAVAAAVVFAGISLVSCKDKTNETEGGETMGTETGGSYDETQAPTGEPGSTDMNPGADGQTGTVNDSASNNTGNTNGSGSTSGSSGSGSGTTGGSGTTSGGNNSGSGSTGNSTNRP